MKTISLAVIAASLLLSRPVYADDAHHPDQALHTPIAKPQPSEKSLPTMEANLTRMRAQLEKLGKAKTPEERQQILAEHLKVMQENMMLTRNMQAGMMNCPMMEQGGMGMMGRGGMGMMGPGAPFSDTMMEKRLDAMDKRMDMMQMMMQSRMGATSGEAAK